MVEQLTSQTFPKATAKGYAVVDFWAEWCGPCKMMGPVFEEIAKELGSVKFGKVNVDDQEDLAAQFEVMSIPTLVVLKDGAEVARIVGFLPKDELKKKVKAAVGA